MEYVKEGPLLFQSLTFYHTISLSTEDVHSRSLPRKADGKGALVVKIERINENTLKFYISYVDIEDRGFDREEIWYNRDRSEELFWQIMEEAHHQESFSLEGPLWIQVQALEKGMEILVTRAQASKDGTKAQLPAITSKQLSVPVQNEKSEKKQKEPETGDDDRTTFILRFSDIEDVIGLSHAFGDDQPTNASLYVYRNAYYLIVAFPEEQPDDFQEDHLSLMLEFGTDSNTTETVLHEYGKRLIDGHALQTLKRYFPV